MIYTHVAAALLAAAVAGAGAWKVQDWRYGAAEAARLEQAAKEKGIQLQRIDTAASGHEADKVRIQTEFVTITEEVEHVVREPFYVDGAGCLDDAGMAELRRAISGGTAPKSRSEGSAETPRPE